MKPFLNNLAWLGLMILAGCCSVDLTQTDRPATLALQNPSATRLAQMYSAPDTAQPGDSGFRLIDGGLPALATRLDLIDQAERTLDLQYYILHSDLTGLLLVQHLLAAADRGVRVRILIDDLNLNRGDPILVALNGHANVEIRRINPFTNRYFPSRLLEGLLNFGRLQRRMHNKVFIADNALAVIGGRNLGDEYFEAHPRLDLRDIDLLVAGPLTRQLSISFDSYWNYRKTLPLTGDSAPGPLQNLRTLLKNSERDSKRARYLNNLADYRRKTLPLLWATGRLMVDYPCKLSPGKPECAAMTFDRFYELFAQAQKELLLISPYFIPGSRGVALFRRMTQQGARVKVLTNAYGATDLKIVQAGYNRYRRALLQGQVELFEFKPTSPTPIPRHKNYAGLRGASQACMHAKAYIMDRRRVFIGSFNHDPRSATFNTEVGVLIDSPELAATLVNLFATYTSPQNSYRLHLEKRSGRKDILVWDTEEDGEAKTYREEPMVNGWQRFRNALLGLLAPEGLL